MLNRDLDPISGRVIRVAIDVGLFISLNERNRSFAELVEDCDCPERGLAPLVHLLTSIGLLAQSEDSYSLAPGTPRYLDKKYPAEWSRLPEVREYEQLERSVRTGRPVRLAVESEADDGDFFAGVAPALFDLHWPAANRLADQVSDRTLRVLDLGAGSAVWSLALAKKRPHVRVVAVDRARVLAEVTTPFLERYEVLPNYELRAGDYHEVPLEQHSYDLVILGHLLHADGWSGSRRLLRRARQALVPGGTLVVAEILASEPRSLDYAANVFDLNMLMLTEAGLVFTALDLTRMVEKGGFPTWSWIDIPGDYPILSAVAGGEKNKSPGSPREI